MFTNWKKLCKDKWFGLNSFFPWTACDANDIEWCKPGEYHQGQKPLSHSNSVTIIPVLELTNCQATKTHFTQNFMYCEKHRLSKGVPNFHCFQLGESMEREMKSVIIKNCKIVFLKSRASSSPLNGNFCHCFDKLWDTLRSCLS